MLILPAPIMNVLTPFAQAFGDRIWDMVQLLVIGAILTPGKRTVSAVLRTMGQQDDAQYQNYHRVLNRAKCSALQVSRILLGLLVAGVGGCAAHHRRGRNTGTTTRGQDQGQRRLSRCGSFESEVYGLQLRIALDQYDAACQRAVEFAGLGIALFDCAGA